MNPKMKNALDMIINGGPSWVAPRKPETNPMSSSRLCYTSIEALIERGHPDPYYQYSDCSRTYKEGRDHESN